MEEITIADDNVNGVQERRLRIDGEIWRILTVYKGGSMKDLRKSLERTIGEKEEENLCIGGDFNARIGGKGRKYEEGENEELGRNSKVINSEGKEMLVMLEGRGWEVGNGNTWGDEEREWTYIRSREVSVVDYVLRNYRAGDKIEKLEIGERVESDHQPIEVTLKTRVEREKGRWEDDIREITIWEEKDIRKYQSKGKEVMIDGEEVEEIWKNLKKRVEESINKKRIRTRNRKIRDKEW